MRTTVDLDERLLDRARRLAAEQGQTLSGILGHALAAYLGSLRAARNDPPFDVLVRGSLGGRFPLPAEIAAMEDEDDVARLLLAGSGRNVAP